MATEEDVKQEERLAREALHARVEHDLTNHAPRAAAIKALMDEATDRFTDLGHWLVEVVPAGRELSTALTRLEELSMWTKAGIARKQTAVPGGPDAEPGRD